MYVCMYYQLVNATKKIEKTRRSINYECKERDSRQKRIHNQFAELSMLNIEFEKNP